MGYSDYTVQITFLEESTGAVEYLLPYVFQITDPEPRTKDVIIRGNRADGSIRIKGGKNSQEIIVRGKLFDNDGYKALTALMTEMRTKVSTENAVLTMKHFEGAVEVVDWSYTVFRNKEIRFPKSYRTESQDFEISFLVLAY